MRTHRRFLRLNSKALIASLTSRPTGRLAVGRTAVPPKQGANHSETNRRNRRTDHHRKQQTTKRVPRVFPRPYSANKNYYVLN
eukprot:6166153-Amphidinium_carterae.1